MKLILSAVVVIVVSLGFSSDSAAQCFPRGGYGGFGGGFRSYGYGGPRVVIAVRPPVPVYRNYGYRNVGPRRYYPRRVYGNVYSRRGYSGRGYDNYGGRSYDNGGSYNNSGSYNDGGSYNNGSYNDDIYDNGY